MKFIKAFDANPSLEVRGVFLDLSKAFDKVWLDGFMYKLKRLGICGKCYGLIHSFLNDRHQTVVLNGQCSNWSKIKAGVPQGSILGPLLFLVYINDLPEGLTTNAKLFADDTSLFSVAHDSTLSSVSLNNDLLKISQWAYQWKMTFNPDVSKQAQEVVFSRKGITTNRCRTELFRNSFLPFTVNEWNKLDSDIKNSDSYEMFHKNLLAFIRPVGNNMYGIYDPFVVKLINRLRLGFSHLRQHKFRHNFADTVNPLCSCTLETENT